MYTQAQGDMNKYRMRKVSRGENKRKGKKWLGVLSATDLRGDVGSTNQCSNCKQIRGETAGTGSKRVRWRSMTED